MKRFTGNPFAGSAVISSYEVWYETTRRPADRLEKAPLKQLLVRFPRASTILEVGRGTGHFTRWFGEQGLQAMGVDLSQSMLTEAGCLESPPCVHGDVLALPFPTAAFDLVVLVTTLEFVPEPIPAIAEALGVARQGLVLGVLNRQSLLGRRSKREGGPIWRVAQLFTSAELGRLVHRAAAGRLIEIIWRTTLWPFWSGALPLPWGGFIGMAVMLP